MSILIWLANVLTLLVGTIVIYLLYEGIFAFFEEPRSFSLPFLYFIIIPLFGGVLAVWFSWKSTGFILGVYTITSIISAIIEIKDYRKYKVDNNLE